MPKELIGSLNSLQWVRNSPLNELMPEQNLLVTAEVYRTNQDLRQDSISTSCNYIELKPAKLEVSKFEKDELEAQGYFEIRLRQLSFYCL